MHKKIVGALFALCILSSGAHAQNPGLQLTPTPAPVAGHGVMVVDKFHVQDSGAAYPSSFVTSWNARVGAVVPATGDYNVAQVTGAAPLASPAFTGTPIAPTPGTCINTTQIPTTAWVQTCFISSTSPTLTGPVTINGDLKFPTWDDKIWLGGSVFFQSSSTVSSGKPVFLGLNVGNQTGTGNENACVGFVCMQELTTGFSNWGAGGGVLTVCQDCANNEATGQHSQKFQISGTDSATYGRYSAGGNTGLIPQAVVSATAAGTVLTVASVSSGTLAAGQSLFSTTIATGGVKILSQAGGAPGGIGTYNLNQAVTIAIAETVKATRTDLSEASCLGTQSCENTGDPDLAGSAFASPTAIGKFALQYDTTGKNNAGGGFAALRGDATVGMTGDNNSGWGFNVCPNITSGHDNGCFSNSAGFSLTTGFNNFFGGTLSGYFAVSASYNAGVGYQSLQTLVDGVSNAQIGNCDPGIVHGSNNSVLGCPSALGDPSGTVVLTDGTGLHKWADYNSTKTAEWTFAAPINAPKIVKAPFQSVTPSTTLTLTLSETVLATIVVPPLPAGARVRLSWMNGFTGTLGTKTTKVYYGATGSGTGGTVYFNAAATASSLSQSTTTTVFQNVTAASQLGVVGVSIIGAGQSTSAPVTSAVNTTVATELTITGTLANVLDSFTLEGYVEEVLYP